MSSSGHLFLLRFRAFAAVLILTLAPILARAQYAFTTNSDGSLNISAYSGNDVALVIPSSATNAGVPTPITSIGFRAFYFNFSLTSVAIPDSITNIGPGAFSVCVFLNNVSFGTNVQTIGDTAFSQCALHSVTLPPQLSNLGISAFAQNSGVTNIALPSQLSSISDGAFQGCQHLTNLVIPDSITNVGTNAFNGCSFLANLTFGTNLQTIGDYAFDGSCIANLVLPPHVSSIGRFAFTADFFLTNVALPAQLVSIGDGAFQNCPLLAGTAVIPDTVTNIGYGVLAGCWSLTNITVGVSNPAYSSLGGVLFDKAQATLLAYPPGHRAAQYSIPQGVLAIAPGAFSATFVTNLVFPDTVTNIASGCFANSSITNFSVDPANNSFSSSNGVLFDKAQSLLVSFPPNLAATYSIPPSVGTVGQYAFFNCTRLAGITFPGSVTNIDDYAFNNCTNLTSITIPDSVLRLGTAAFQGCSFLAHVSIGRGLVTIGDGAFSGCSFVTITLPATIGSIGSACFSSCANLRGVYFAGNPATTPGSLLSSSPSAAVYYLSGNTGWTNTYAGVPAYLWNPHALSDTRFGVHSNQFGFTIAGTSNITLVIEAATNFANPVWTPLNTIYLTNGSFPFTDPASTNYPARFYRFRSP